MISWEKYHEMYPHRKRKRYNKELKLETKGKEGEDVGITEVAGKLVGDVNSALNPSKPLVKIDFNVEVGAVLVACDENRAKIDQVQDIITDCAEKGITVPSDVIDALEEINNTFLNIKKLTEKMIVSYRHVGDGLAVIEKNTIAASKLRQKLNEIRATRVKEKTEAQ